MNELIERRNENTHPDIGRRLDDLVVRADAAIEKFRQQVEALDCGDPVVYDRVAVG